MSSPRPLDPFSHLAMLQESLHRVLEMLSTLPKLDQKVWESILLQYSVQTRPAASAQVFTADLLFDEIKRLWKQLDVCCSLGVGVTKKEAYVIPTQSVPTTSEESKSSSTLPDSRPRKTQSYAADDLVSFTWPLLSALDSKYLSNLAAQLNALYDILQVGRPKIDNAISADPVKYKRIKEKSLDDVEYALTSLGSVVAQALNERKPEEEVKEASQKQRKEEDLRVATMHTFLASHPIPSQTLVCDLTYTLDKYKQFLAFIDALAGRAKPPAADRRTDVSNQMASSPRIADDKQTAGALLSMKEIDSFKKKEKVQELFATAYPLSKLTEETPALRYHLILLHYINTLAETSERGYEASSKLFSPSMLRVRMTDFLVKHLEKKDDASPGVMDDYQGNVNKALYDLKKSTPLEIETLRKKEWVVHATLDIYASVLVAAQFPSQMALVAMAFDGLVNATKTDYRDDILMAMRKRHVTLVGRDAPVSRQVNLLKALLQLTYPLTETRRQVLEKIISPVVGKAVSAEARLAEQRQLAIKSVVDMTKKM